MKRGDSADYRDFAVNFCYGSDARHRAFLLIGPESHRLTAFETEVGATGRSALHVLPGFPVTDDED